MQIIKNIPLYNRKGQRITSITEQEVGYIDETKIDERFFIVEKDFIVIKSKFFRQEHLVKNWTFCMHKEKVHFKRKEDLKYKKVLFVLESPHHNEFDYDDGFKSLKPLIGNLEVFKTNFPKLMEEITSDDSLAYEVTLYIPVPFQNSLHYLFRRNIKEQTKISYILTISAGTCGVSRLLRRTEISGGGGGANPTPPPAPSAACHRRSSVVADGLIA